MKDIENKSEVISAARTALNRPGEREFWDEVEARILAETGKEPEKAPQAVEPRHLTESR